MGIISQNVTVGICDDQLFPHSRAMGIAVVVTLASAVFVSFVSMYAILIKTIIDANVVRTRIEKEKRNKEVRRPSRVMIPEITGTGPAEEDPNPDQQMTASEISDMYQTIPDQYVNSITSIPEVPPQLRDQLMRAESVSSTSDAQNLLRNMCDPQPMGKDQAEFVQDVDHQGRSRVRGSIFNWNKRPSDDRRRLVEEEDTGDANSSMRRQRKTSEPQLCRAQDQARRSGILRRSSVYISNPMAEAKIIEARQRRRAAGRNVSFQEGER